MKHEKMRLSREISGGEEKKPQSHHTEGKKTWSVKQMCCAGRERSLRWVCDQLWFVFFVKDSGRRGKWG